MIRICKCRYNCFNDIKNFFTYGIYTKVKSALRNKQRMYFKKFANGCFYTFKIHCINKTWGLEIRNISELSAVALMIPSDIILNLKYTDFKIY